MTTKPDKKLPPGILRIVAKLGRDVVVVKETAAAVPYNAQTGEATPGTDSYATKMAPGAIDKRWHQSGLAQATDTGGVFAAQGSAFTPELGDVVQFKGFDWRIVQVKTLRTGTLIGGWTVVLQRT